MKNSKRLLSSIVLIVGLMSTVASAAELMPNWSLSEGTGFPTNMIEGGGPYTLPLVLTNDGKSGDFPLEPSSFTIISSAQGLVLSSMGACQGAVLSPGQSCTFDLEYSPAVVGSNPLQLQIQQYGYVWKKMNQPLTLTVNSSQSVVDLSSEDAGLSFHPSQTVTWTIKNNSDTLTAQGVNVTIPASINKDVTAVSNCGSIAPEGTCTITFNADSDLQSGLSGSITAEGINTDQATVNFTTSDQGSAPLSVNSIAFANPGTQNIVLTNVGAATIDVTSAAMGEGSHDVSMGALPSACGALAPSKSCLVPVTALATAYGNADVFFTYNVAGGSTQEISTSLVVGQTKVTINGGVDIIVNAATGSFNIQNTGAFAWVNPSVAFEPVDTWVEATSNTCTGTILPGAVCTISYSTKQPTTGTAIVVATGLNIPKAQANLLTDLFSISVDVPANQHLSYGSVTLTNLSNTSEVLSNISTTGLPTNVVACDSTGDNCEVAYKSTCSEGMTLGSLSSCKLWYKALPATSLSAASVSEGLVSVSLSEPTAVTYSAHIDFGYQNALYVGGRFNAIGSANTLSYGIAKWDGANWTVLNKVKSDSQVNALALFKGDLYAGGDFTSLNGAAVSNIARWNGAEWAGVSTGVSGSSSPVVKSLLTATFGNSTALYVGGQFTKAGGNSANNIAKWDGSAWSPLTEGVFFENGHAAIVDSLAADANYLYAGGQFDRSGNGAGSNNIAKWDGSAWTSLDSEGVNDTVYALYSDGTNLYIGGTFSSAGGPPSRYIVKWTGSSWVNLDPEAGAPNGTVYSISALGTSIIAMGDFTNYISSLNGTTWSPFDTQSPNDVVYTSTNLGNYTYFGGAFGHIGASSVHYLGFKDGTGWNINNNFVTNNYVYSLLVAPSLSLTAAN